MSSPSCVSHADSTSICAADASLDMPPAAARYIPCGDSICFALRQNEIGEKRVSRIAALVAEGNISNFERSEKYIDCSQREQISSCEATYRHTKGIDIELRSNISTKRKDFFQMTDNKNQLREDAIEFAIQISDLCDEIKGCSVYVNQIVRSSSSIGANIHEAKYAQSKADFINKLEISLKECSETEYWLELISRKGKMSESKYKDLRNKCGSIRRRLIASITTAKENA